MNKIGQFGVGLMIAGLSVSVCGAKELSAPKVFHDIPAQKGQWRVEILELDGPGRKKRDAAMPGTMSIRMDSFTDMAKNAERRSGPGQEAPRKCKSEVVEDAADRGVFLTTCEDGASVRSTIVREGPKVFLIEASGSGQEAPFSMKSRYSYEGAGKAKGGPGVVLDKSSEVCQ
jgi:hypothetical protein